MFLCLSEHEGFCVPLAEAMHFGKPIIALKKCAVPETLGRAGLLLEDASPEIAAAAIDRVMKDEALKEAFARGREKQLEKFAYESVKEKMMECIMA